MFEIKMFERHSPGMSHSVVAAGEGQVQKDLVTDTQTGISN